MELIFSIVQAFSAANDVVKVYGSVSDWVIAAVNKWSRTASNATIENQVGKIAKATDEDIRKTAARAVAASPKTLVTDAKLEELIVLLHNMTRNVRYRSSSGSMDASLLRGENSLNDLLHGIAPTRKRGESVAPGSPWILRRHLGMGSFGEVWMAENPDYPKLRAYKFFIQDVSGEWLRREQAGLTAILKRLNSHQNIVDFEDVQSTDCPYPYLALEYLGGGSLEEWIIKDPLSRPALDVHEIIRQVVSGLSAAHAQGIEHRDIKPANILMTVGPDVTIKIGDFGLARVASTRREGTTQMVSLAGVVGTPLYLPPEAMQRGRRHKPTQDDVFALGVVWYQLVIGAIERPPYDFAERLRSKGLDSHTIGLIERCLAHPTRRFNDAREVEAALGDPLPPIKDSVPGVPDVQHITREYLATFAH